MYTTSTYLDHIAEISWIKQQQTSDFFITVSIVNIIYNFLKDIGNSDLPKFFKCMAANIDDSVYECSLDW